MQTETFKINKDFLQIFTYFLIKYSSDHASYSAKELIRDLHERFVCLAAALVRESAPGFSREVVSPDEKCTQKQIDQILDNEVVLNAISSTLAGERQGGDHTRCNIEIPIGNGELPVQMELIPLPCFNIDGEVPKHRYALMLIDPAELPPIENRLAEREFERTLNAQFLAGWWAKVMLPRSYSPQVHFAPDYHVTVSELLCVASRNPEYLRRPNPPDWAYSDVETTAASDFWDNWEPRLPIGGLTEEELTVIRQQTKNLIYWCRWLKAHDDLEEEQLSVSSWIKPQRQSLFPLLAQIDKLRETTANAFLSGHVAPPFLSPENRHSPEFVIGRKTLLRFALNQWLLPTPSDLRTDVSNGALSDIEFCRILHGLGVIAHYLLGDQELTGDVIHRLTQMMARYGHGYLGIPARIDLRAHLLHAARGEPALHTLKRYYRDHFFHALEVCFLGHVLLETKLQDDSYLWQLVAKQLGIEEDKQTVLRLWYTAALFHDIGYAMDVLFSSREFLGFFRHSKALQRLETDFKKATDCLSKHKEVKGLGVKLEAGMERDHGVVGAIHLRTLLERIGKDDETVQPEDYDAAIKAIALHNLRRPQDKISFADQPIAFLLVVCDQLQEWKRPSLPFATSPNWLIARLGGASADLAGLEGAFERMTTNLEVQLRDSANIGLQFPPGESGQACLMFEMEYNKRINHNWSVFLIWLDATLNFQRLDFEGLPLDISVKYVTPRDERIEQSQMHRLRNAAHETHMAFLSRWFPTVQDPAKEGTLLTNGAVEYRYGEEEELTLHLRELSGKALITRGTNEFLMHLQMWKHFNDDREFPGDYASVIPE